ncbi:MAG TPA: insulinase family protein, partial [Rhodothermales bacterium]|nr:insulinase family protein [Rhodothermales bacterium]
MPDTAAPPSPAHPAFTFVKSAGGIEEYRLERNGLAVLLLPESAAPVVAFQVTYRVGSRNEGAGLTGATHLLEHLMFKGTERFNKRLGTSVFNVLQ